MLYSMDLTVLNLAVPALSADLAPSAAQLLWIVDIYGFMVAGFLVTMGTLGDRIGRRRLLLIGAAAFGVASLLAAFASSAPMLIALRALLGIAGATLAPSTLSLIRTMFRRPAERTTAIGVWVSSYSVGAAIGPVLGGALLESFAWGSVFLINVPVMLLLLAVGPRLLPEFRDPAARRLDLPSAALSLAAVLATVYGLKQLAEHGAGGLAALAVVVGLALGALFVQRQRRLADPLIELRLFTLPAFGASLAIYLMACMAMFGVYLFIAQYLQLVLALSPLRAGLWTVPWALAFVAGSMATPALVARSTPAASVTAGLLLAACGFALLTQAGADTGPWLLVGATVTLALGLSPAFTLATDLVVGAVPPERAGAAAAISESCAELGGALGIALFGSLGAALYRRAMASTELPGLPAEALEAARATLGGAAAAAAQLPPALAAALLDNARQAFLQGLHVAAAIAGAMMLMAALLAAIGLRQPAARAHAAAAASREERPTNER